jgi:hypothetical protein
MHGFAGTEAFFGELCERKGRDGIRRGSTIECYCVFLHSYPTLIETLEEPINQ